MGLRSVFLQAGVGGVLLSLGARAPRKEDLEERQFVNLVEEMAIAAGLPPPRVMLIDSEVPNGAVVGSDPGNARLILTRGVLDGLDREETQGVVAHLVGSVANGDLAIALTIISVFQAIALVIAVFEAVLGLSPSAAKAVRRALKLAFAKQKDATTADAVAEMLQQGLDEPRNDGLSAAIGQDRDHSRTLLGGILAKVPIAWILLLPFLLAYLILLLIRFELYLLRVLIVGPLLMLLWRGRRYLADATAVQLTRNPDGLMRALNRLAAKGALVPGGQWAEHLFIVGSEASAGRAESDFREEWTRLRNQPKKDVLSLVEGSSQARRRYQKRLRGSDKGSWSESLGGSVASHPPLAKRLERLRKLGASRLPEPSPRHPSVSHWQKAAGIAIFSPLLALMAYLLLLVVAATFLFAALSALLFTGAAMMIVHALLG